jgi:hypothetical protein
MLCDFLPPHLAAEFAPKQVSPDQAFANFEAAGFKVEYPKKTTP